MLARLQRPIRLALPPAASLPPLFRCQSQAAAKNLTAQHICGRPLGMRVRGDSLYVRNRSVLPNRRRFGLSNWLCLSNRKFSQHYQISCITCSPTAKSHSVLPCFGPCSSLCVHPSHQVIDAYFGLFKKSLAAPGVAEWLVRPEDVEKPPAKAFDDLDVMADGSVVFTDASSVHPIRQFTSSIVNANGDGRCERNYLSLSLSLSFNDHKRGAAVPFVGSSASSVIGLHGRRSARGESVRESKRLR